MDCLGVAESQQKMIAATVIQNKTKKAEKYANGIGQNSKKGLL